MTIKISSNPNELLQQCFSFQNNGQFEKAIKGYKKLLGIYPNNPQLLGSLGMALLQSNNLKEGCLTLEKSLRADPNQPNTIFNLALGYEKQNRFQDALLEFDKAIKLQPRFNEVYIQKVKVLIKLKEFESAINIADQIILTNPTTSIALLDKGICLHNLNKDSDAIEIYNQALIYDKENPALLNARGISELALNKFEDAILSFKNSIQVNGANPQPWNNLGLALHRLNKFDAAIASFDKAITINSKYADAYSNRGRSLQALKQIEKALDDFNMAIKIESRHPDAHWNKALLKILIGNYEEGWKLYEWRWKSFSEKWARHYQQPLWLGEESLKAKSILIYPEQGYGDFIQFFRYIPMLQALGAKVILETPTPLVHLINTSSSEVEIIESGKNLPKFDFQCPIMSLPLALRTKIESIPDVFPYLSVAPEKIKLWQTRLGTKTNKRIGIAWSGSKDHKNDHNRSITLSQLSSLFEMPFEFHSLQKEIRESDQFYFEKSSIKDHQADINEFSDTAALIENIDLIVTVDTAIAHLAGSLKKTFILLLPYNSDYRWMLDSKSTPWYPSAIILRQGEIGSWSKVISELKTILLTLT